MEIGNWIKKLMCKQVPVKVLVVISVNTIECAYCHASIKTGTYAVQCPFCYAVHHAECWKEGRGCGVFGCKCSPKRKG
ncbi:hypothetical protein KKE26_10955 [bacterium]|nr:hypothetical protein [bacterium]MBU1752461.1 hypothetical protein [bacterium]